MATRVPKRLEADRRVRGSSLPLGIQGLLETIEGHDSYTRGHSHRVGQLAGLIAGEMGLGSDDVEVVTLAALVHDIGKLGVPEEILKKTERLTEREYELVKLHPVLGAGILSRVPGAEPLVPIVLAHHERWDGNGYPYGLVATEIPLEARIIFVCDAFDAMTSERPYGRVLTTEEAVDEIVTCQGAQFDPLVVAAISKLQLAGSLKDLVTN